MNTRKKQIKNHKVISFLYSIIILVVFDVIILLVGTKIDLFSILEHGLDNATMREYYWINNSNLCCVIVICIINVLIIYHSIVSATIQTKLDAIDANGAINEKISRIEAHLLNFDQRSISFEHLSAIEAEIGIAKQSVHNEIWVLTNNFEERHDTKEGKELRDAIISNLKTNVDYYYVVPKSKVTELKHLGIKLKSDTRSKKTTAKFMYTVDDALDFIPTPYFDIIIYIKANKDGNETFAESSSKIYYCFSMSTNSTECFYQEVLPGETWDMLIQRTEEYKKDKAFIDLLKEVSP